MQAPDLKEEGKMRTAVKFLTVICIIAVGSPAFATDIINGGFESGNFTAGLPRGQRVSPVPEPIHAPIVPFH